MGGHGDGDGGDHCILGLELGGRTRLGDCVGAVAKACRACQPKGLKAAENGGAVVEDAWLLQHEQLSQRPARTLPLGNVHRQHHLFRLRLFTLNLKKGYNYDPEMIFLILAEYLSILINAPEAAKIVW